MTSRGLTPSLFNQIETNFTPNVLDEPDARMVITSLLLSRFLDGVFLTNTKIDLDEYAQARTLGEEDVRARLGDTKAFKNFKDESDILISMYGEFLQGLFVPGDSTASARRFSPFMVRTTNDFSIIENAGAVYHEYQAGQYLYASQRNQIAVVLINKLKELQQMPAIAQQTSGPFPEQVYMQAKGAMLENLGSIVEGSENMDFGDFFARVFQINSMVNQLQQNPQTQPIARLLSTVFGTELGLFFENILPRQLTPFLEQMGTEFNQETVQLMLSLADKEEGYQPANELEGALLNILKQPMSGILPEDSSIELITSTEQLEAKIDESVVQLEEQYTSNKEVGEMYLANQEELDAQMDLIFRLLITAAQL
jgi:hypothetical protein